jgi:hypothetical protein
MIVTYAINGHEVSQADFLADEDAFESPHHSYIRPVYRAATLVGFCVYVRGEAVGRVFPEYKHAALLLLQVREVHL